MNEQLPMFAPPEIVRPPSADGETLTLAQKFERFRAANPEVERVIVEIARDLKFRAGFTSCGIALIFERMRWLYAIATRGDEYKLNNNWRAFYARRIMATYADLDGFFHVREQKAGAE
jgi:hypothetical protein